MKYPVRISTWTAELQNDLVTTEVFLPLSDAFLFEQDWRMGNRIRFEDVKPGSMKLVNFSKGERDKSIGDAP
jgi:hypothetical protein